MNPILAVLATMGVVGFLVAIILAARSRYAKSGERDLLGIGATGFVNTKLDPDGSILIDGELWCARSKHGAVVDPTKKVIVVGAQGHLLLVEPISDRLQLVVPLPVRVFRDREFVRSPDRALLNI